MSIADAVGGAARSAYKIHSGVRALGIRSRMVVQTKVTSDPDVRSFRGRIWRAIDRPFRALNEAIGLQYLLLPSSLALLVHPWIRGADIVQIYNVHGGYLSPLILAPLSRLKPVVWRLSDMWAFTGHCAYSYDSERWRIGCGSCPHLRTYPALSRDTTHANWELKRWLYSLCDLHIVAPSKWLLKLAGESPLLRRFPMSHIPNGVDTSVFRPTDRGDARRELGLPAAGQLILFSGTEARKGGDLLAAALRRLAAAHVSLGVVILGRDNPSDTAGLPTYRLGHIDDDRRLALAYSAADLFVLPASADNLPNTVLESLACGTPVVATEVGGIPDAVRPGLTGYLARAGDPKDVADRIRAALQDEIGREGMGREGRRIAETEYALNLQAERFAELYRTITRERPR